MRIITPAILSYEGIQYRFRFPHCFAQQFLMGRSLYAYTTNTDKIKDNAATTACCFQVGLKYPTNSQIKAFSVKYHFVFAPKPTHFRPCCLARSSARNT